MRSTVTAPFMAYDAEKLSDQKVEQLYRSPPGFEPAPRRSALVVGVVGAGKTMLFRYIASQLDKNAVQIDLSFALNALTDELGISYMTAAVPPEVIEPMLAKARTLIGLKLLALTGHYAADVPRYLVDAVSPSSTLTGAIEERALQAADARISSYMKGPSQSTLISLVDDIGERFRRTRGSPLVLLLDRADAIPTPVLDVLTPLLDQSRSCLVLMSTKPGVTNLAAGATTAYLSGDVPRVILLGTHAYDAEWNVFMMTVLESWFGSKWVDLPEPAKCNLLWLSGGSVRLALELTENWITSGSPGAVRWAVSWARSRMQLLHARSFHVDTDLPKHFLRAVAQKLPAELDNPVRLHVDFQYSQTRLIQSLSDYDYVISYALQLGILNPIFSQGPVAPWTLPTVLDVPAPILLLAREEYPK